jgi:hypothetical protein
MKYKLFVLSVIVASAIAHIAPVALLCMLAIQKPSSVWSPLIVFALMASCFINGLLHGVNGTFPKFNRLFR